MDEENRKNAKQRIRNAQNLDERYMPKNQVVNEYLRGIEFFLKIVNKSVDDFKALSSTYHNVATIYFNKGEHAKAAQAYLDSIQQLQKTELNDDKYRTITKRYIDLADACCELLNQQAANEAMLNAIKAFSLIKEKNAQELAIGDPVANFAQFRNYYERQLSTTSYLKSTKFINHGQLLGEQQQERALFDKLEGISINDAKKIDDSLEAMLSLLSVVEPQVQPQFSAVLLSAAPSAGDYRKMAVNFLRLAQSHIKSGLITKAIKETYEQAIDTLRLIQQPNEKDCQIINELTKHVNFLKTKPEQMLSSSSAAVTFFARAPEINLGEDEIVDETEDVEMNM